MIDSYPERHRVAHNDAPTIMALATTYEHDRLGFRDTDTVRRIVRTHLHKRRHPHLPTEVTEA